MVYINFLMTAIFAALVVAVIAWIADYFVTNAGLGFPKQIIWLIALVVWLYWVFAGGTPAF